MRLGWRKRDGRIQALVLQPEGLTGAGLSKLQELAREISLFRETGKKVIAIGVQFTRDQYYLAGASRRDLYASHGGRLFGWLQSIFALF